MRDEGPNVGARARARLLRLARERGDDFQLVLLRYAHERLLYRLAASRHAGQFVLKGAALFTVWTGHPHRATRDVDLLAFGDPAEGRIRGHRRVRGAAARGRRVGRTVGSIVVGSRAVAGMSHWTT